MKKIQLLASSSLVALALSTVAISSPIAMDRPDDDIREVANTNGKVFTGILYNIRSKSGNVLNFHDAPNTSKADRVYHLPYNHPNTREGQKVCLQARGDGYYNIRSKFGNVLNFRDAPSTPYPGEVYHLPYNHPDTQEHQKVVLQPTEDGYYNIRSKFGNVLNFYNDSNTTKLDVVEHIPYNHPHTKEDQKVYFEPTDYVINALITDFQYVLPPKLLTTKDLIESRIINNPSEAEIIETISHTRTFTHTTTYSFTESLKIGARTKVKGGFPFAASTEAEFSMEAGFEANQQEAKTTQVDYSISRTVRVPPHASVKISAYANFIEDIVCPFTATVKMTALASYLRSDGTLVQNKAVNGNVINQYLKHKKYEGNITRIEGDAVYATISGTFMGSYGIESVFQADPL